MPDEMSDELRDEYDLDYAKAKPNRFATGHGSLKSGGRVFYLEPEVASRFASSEEVNRLLKALLEAMPPPTTNVGEPQKA
jgi:hypothetical protein